LAANNPKKFFGHTQKKNEIIINLEEGRVLWRKIYFNERVGTFCFRLPLVILYWWCSNLLLRDVSRPLVHQS
jgi:hypothetical protein